MDTTLVTVTVLSMSMAAALSVIVWRLLRDERRRSEARIAALANAALSGSRLQERASTPVPPVPPKGGNYRPEVVPPKGGSSASDAIPPKGGSYKEGSGGRAGGSSEPDELLLHPVAAPVTTSALFVEPPRSSPWGNRLAVMAGLALLVASTVFFAMTASRARGAAPARNAAADRVAGQAGLELTSLHDWRKTDSLTITGMVQNPVAGSLLTHVTVMAYAFDDKGTFLASGRAPLDIASLAPGDQSPFAVTVPVTDTVARYRIGFRGEDGRVIGHVDRRQPPSVAAHW